MEKHMQNEIDNALKLIASTIARCEKALPPVVSIISKTEKAQIKIFL